MRGARSQETRREPATVAEMREATQDVRARLFVLFLDTEHVEFGPAFNIKSPLIQSLNQLIGGDDLVAVMTAGMQARDLTFRRRTTSIEELLKGVWSERDHRLKRSRRGRRDSRCVIADAERRGRNDLPAARGPHPRRARGARAPPAVRA